MEGHMNGDDAQARLRNEMISKGKQELARDIPLARADYQAAQQRQLDNMERLRKLRLERKILEPATTGSDKSHAHSEDSNT
jgi:hypothetical protein